MNRLAIKILVLGFSVLIIAVYMEIEDIADYYISIDFYWAFLSFVFIFFNQVLSTFRFKIVLSIFRISLPFWECHRVNIFSILSGVFFFNFFGQSISRSYLIKESANPQASFIVTALERGLSLSLLLLASVGAAIFVFGGVGFEYIPVLPIILGSFFVLLSFVCVYFISLYPKQKNEINFLLKDGWGSKLWITISIVSLMHISMLAAYLSLIIGMTRFEIVNEYSVLASLLTMLGGALPISFGGWGAREVSASFAFKAASLSSELGVSAGIGVGLLTVVALCTNIFIIFFMQRVLGKFKFDIYQSNRLSRDVFGRRLILILSWVSLPVVFILILVQFPIPLSAGHISLNIADPLAVVLGMTFLLVIVQQRAWGKVWKNNCIPYWLLSAFLIVILSYIIGVTRIGFSEWASYNRLVGSGILLCYLIIGLVSVAFWGDFSVRTAIRALSVAIVVLAIMEFALRMVFGYDSLLSLGWHGPRWTGLLNNPNSYAFFLVSVFCLIFSFERNFSNLRRDWITVATLSLVMALIYLTMSRAALGSMIVLLAVLLSFDWKKVVASVLGAVMLWCVVIGLNEIFELFVQTTVGVAGFNEGRVAQFGEMQYDRIASLYEGWKLFLESPVFGAGLGVFHEIQALKGHPLVIHNSFLWVLAEMGGIGFLIICVVPLFWVSFIFLKGQWRVDPYQRTLVLLVLNAAIMGLAHELLYQRVFWLILGMLFAAPFALRTKMPHNAS
ncbi:MULTISPECIES: lysylphosphatidylglycerol synthase domain-containing protein [unclassified Thalassospira]|uniref:lysylphosphatidylglycerol synthase domain-containing protein n=1 Tax=unclassified Thalassospira TaxID=2648997 RepID=UPI0007A63CF4|nr:MULTISPECIES: lysylphosphatidylglycerol synthase domain-containing protein [unclassified Thalassospira]KZC98957.1 hypothetical protein AUQ41_10465 [Thalassospira sp. MCCC 1A02898]ONH89378.1 hypothetical protein TH47_02170 [Thalassospira sp. MCCC 1A02803]